MAKDLSGFSYTEDDEAAMLVARQEDSPWESKHIKDLKSRIKKFHLSLTNETCCYCGKEFHGEFTMVIDVEHIVPKKKYDALMFNIANLSVSCKRCNLNIKGEDTDFLIEPFDCADVGQHDKYKFVHPNLDDRKQHLSRYVVQANECRIVKYVTRSTKGEYTYTYFKLDELEIDSFDLAQGANQVNDSEAGMLSEIRAMVKAIE